MKWIYVLAGLPNLFWKSKKEKKTFFIAHVLFLCVSKNPKLMLQNMLFIVVWNDSLLIVCLTILSHGCGSRRFDCLLLVFIRRCRLAVSYYKQHCGCLSLVHFDPRCGCEWLEDFDPHALFWLEAVPSRVCCGTDWLLCCLIVGIHPSGISILLSLIDIVRVKSNVNGFFNPMGVPMWVSVNNFNLVLKRIMFEQETGWFSRHFKGPLKSTVKSAFSGILCYSLQSSQYSKVAHYIIPFFLLNITCAFFY